MERSEILTAMSALKLYGMKAAFDEIIATAVKRQHEPQRIVGDLLTAEITEKQARSIRYQITIAQAAAGQGHRRLQLRGHADQRDPGARPAGRRLPGAPAHVVLVGGTGTGKRTSPLPSPVHASAMVPEAGSSMLSIWSTNWRPRPVPADKGDWPTNCAGWTSWFSTNSAICRLPSQAASFCSI